MLRRKGLAGVLIFTIAFILHVASRRWVLDRFFPDPFEPTFGNELGVGLVYMARDLFFGGIYLWVLSSWINNERVTWFVAYAGAAVLTIMYTVVVLMSLVPLAMALSVGFLLLVFSWVMVGVVRVLCARNKPRILRPTNRRA